MAETLYGILVFRDPGPRWHVTEDPPLTKTQLQQRIQEEWGAGRKTRTFDYDGAENFDVSRYVGKNPPSQS